MVSSDSSDGDSRLLKGMVIKTHLGTIDPVTFTFEGVTINLPEFHAILTTKQIFIQDTVHALNKLHLIS